MSSILIIGADPADIDFDAPGAPAGVTAQSVIDGLNGSRDRLIGAGHDAEILLTGDASVIERQVRAALDVRAYDIVVIGAGLRTLPSMAEHFEKLINIVHADAPQARLAFNSAPDDSDVAALRQLAR